MMRESYSDRHHHPPVLESMEIVVALVLMAVCWFSWYVARERYHLTDRQLAELATYLIIAALAVVGTTILLVTQRARREREWHILPWLYPESATNESPKQRGNRMQSFSVMTFTANPGTGRAACASCKASC